MPRREVLFLPDQYFHFYNRGNDRQPVFFERDNYVYFLRGIKKYVLGQVDVIAYCLMPTHYHILVRVRQLLQTQTSEVLKTSEVFPPATSAEQSKAVSLAMQKFGISYTKAINKRFGRVGALFQGQFKAKPVTNYDYLRNLCVYIHTNPVKNGLAALPEDWEFSNYQEWMKLRPGTLVNHGFIHDNFGSSKDYQKLVMDYVEKDFRGFPSFDALD